MTNAEYFARLAVIEAADAVTEPHRRFGTRDELASQLKLAGAQELKTHAEFEVLLSLSGQSHSNEPPSHDAFHEKLRSEAGLNWAADRFRGSSSPIVRASAGWLLWSSGERRFRRLAADIAGSFLDAHKALAAHALKTSSLSAAIEAVRSLACCIEVVRQTNQSKSLHGPILDAALSFALGASSETMRRWRLDVGVTLGCLPKELLSLRRSELTAVVGMLEEGADGERDRVPIRLGFLRAAIRLRNLLDLPESPTHGRASVARVLEADGGEGPPLRGIQSLREALEEYQRIPGHANDVRRVQRSLEERLIAARANLTPVPFELRVSFESVERFLRPYRELPIERGLNFFAHDPRIQIERDEALKRSEENDSAFLHRQLFSTVYFHGDGTTHRPHTEEGQRRARALADVAHQLQVNSIFLRFIFDALREKGMNPSDVARQLMHESLFEEAERPFVECGVRHWAAGDYISALSVLVPRTERLLRRLAGMVGENTTVVKPDSDQRSMLGPVLDRLIAAAADAATRNLFFELRVFLDGDGGMAVRHEIAHGLAEVGLFTASTADTLIGLLLRLSVVTSSQAVSDLRK